jgi:hypothetical protein
MALYRVGSVGPEVTQIQKNLRELGLYAGPLDGKFGGGTEQAVVAFQRAHGLVDDGEVGDITWKALFGEGAAPVPAITKEALPYRCLALTGSIETGAPPPECFAGLTGDFDGQGISFGAIQFALGTGSLAELLNALDARSPKVLDDVFQDNAAVLRAVLKSPTDEQLAWARSIQHAANHQLDEPWQGQFKSLGRRPECQAVQVDLAMGRYTSGRGLCAELGLWSERAVALMFDIKVQNGSISPLVMEQIKQDFAALAGLDREALEVERMRIVARRRAAVCNPRWVADVLARKTAIAEGRGTIHGRMYDLAADYAIGLVDAALPAAVVAAATGVRP